MDNRTAESQCLLADDRDDRKVELLVLLLRRAVDVVEVVEVHVGAVDIAVRRVTTEKCDPTDLASDAPYCVLVDVVDRAPVSGDFRRAVDVARRAYPLVFTGDLVGTPDEVLEPFSDLTTVDRLALVELRHCLDDSICCCLGDACRAFRHEE